MATLESAFVSCVVPVHNEAGHIKAFISDLHAALSSYCQSFEILIVDDGSTDDSVEIISTLTDLPELKTLIFSRNFGKEAAISCGLKESKGDAVVIIDSDYEHPISLIETMLKEWIQGSDVVYGVRNDRHKEGFIKKAGAKLFYKILLSSEQIDIPNGAGDFRLLDKKVVDVINAMPEKTRFMKGLYTWPGFSSKALAYDVGSRPSGEKMCFSKLFSLAISGITSFTTLPLRLASILGVGISSLAGLYGVYVFINAVMFDVPTPGWPTLVVIICFIGGIQMLLLGILGEYLAAIYKEVKARPPYVLAKTLDNSLLPTTHPQHIDTVSSIDSSEPL